MISNIVPVRPLYNRIKAGGREDIAFPAVPHKGNNFKKGVYKCA